MSEREKTLVALLRETCGLLNSYADTFTWDEELNAAKDDLYARIARALAEVMPDEE